jgi:hypothetical protein
MTIQETRPTPSEAERAEEWAGWQALAREYTGCDCSICTAVYKRAATNHPPLAELCSAANRTEPTP